MRPKPPVVEICSYCEDEFHDHRPIRSTTSEEVLSKFEPKLAHLSVSSCDRCHTTWTYWNQDGKIQLEIRTERRPFVMTLSTELGGPDALSPPPIVNLVLHGNKAYPFLVPVPDKRFAKFKPFLFEGKVCLRWNTLFLKEGGTSREKREK
jgi:hypothetical protein